MTNHGFMAMTLTPRPHHTNEKRFATIQKIKERSKQELLAISKSAFQKYFEAWKKRLHKCIIFEGDYFEEGIR